MSPLVARILCVLVGALASGCFTLKPNDRRDGAVFLEFPLDQPKPPRDGPI
ncbi:MAG: hypothetical protein ACR2OZ_17115 [Verrucomicrobiales bacterium]